MYVCMYDACMYSLYIYICMHVCIDVCIVLVRMYVYSLELYDCMYV